MRTIAKKKIASSRQYETQRKNAEHLRKERCRQVDEAISMMRETGQTITKKALAEEVGISERALYSDYMKLFLLQYPEFNPESAKTGRSKDSDALAQENSALKQKNTELTSRNKALREELLKVKSQYSSLEQRYQRLLGSYQTEVGSKIIPI